MPRALLLFSGGLDSLLSYKILQSQGVDVTAIFFKTYFFSQERAEEIAKANNMKLRVKDIGKDHLQIVKKPKFGFGKRRNPCIDCHMLMIKKAKQIMEKEKFDFIATGEVLGQRPMSQNDGALKKIEREVGLENKIVRPLSAKNLPLTEAEEKGLVDREKLYGVRGRGRGAQLVLVSKFGISKYQSPAGGCVLTDPAFSKRLADLAEYWPDYTNDDVAVLRTGRIFWHGKNMIVIGRDKEECEKLGSLALPTDFVVNLVDVPGPTTIIRGKEVNEETIDYAISLTIKYAHKAEALPVVKVKIKWPEGEAVREIKQ
ncbi:tRNA 4-thiouridine(8) synthase ThiI [Patescibacteria group bacterium]|nr:tRNA 4-thiouridine(8) synthase ThiI [Patescibacteria group bacterium]MBU1922327.1 tRNA 4-thiouridine(8) synthase ThiI [Patescibacteria group bacterium]